MADIVAIDPENFLTVEPPRLCEVPAVESALLVGLAAQQLDYPISPLFQKDLLMEQLIGMSQEWAREISVLDPIAEGGRLKKATEAQMLINNFTPT